jgi:hypothetical protein
MPAEFASQRVLAEVLPARDIMGGVGASEWNPHAWGHTSEDWCREPKRTLFGALWPAR